MNNKSQKKEKKESKSAEKKYSSKKPLINLLLYQNSQLPNSAKQSEDQFGKTTQYEKIIDRSHAKSSMSTYNQDKRLSMDIMMPSKKMTISNWIEEQPPVLHDEKRSRNNYEYLHVIGKGGFGKVYKVKQKKSGCFFAMKEMSKAVILAKKSNESVRNQRQFLKILKHKFIVNMRHAFQDRQSLYLVMDLMPGGDLRYHICKRHKFTQEQTRFFAACIFISLQYMHSEKVIHRDIKPENLVFDAKGYLHLTDLGIAKQYRNNNYSDTSGTPGYMAPEVMTKQNHSYQVDYYALGVIIYELMMGKRPYVGKDRKAIREQILARQTVIKKNQIPEGWSIEAADFVNKLIQRRPMARLGWSGSNEVRNHIWLKDFPWDQLASKQLDSPFRSFSKYNPDDVRYQPTKEDEQMVNNIKQNRILLRKSSVQEIFEGYTFQEELKQSEYHTTSSEMSKKKKQELNKF